VNFKNVATINFADIKIKRNILKYMLKTYLTNIHRPKRLSEIDWENNLTVVNRITI